ncbi:MAG TPA: methionine adenosyltransferase [Methylomirabilota bacterium]|jgi:S-adenosylmethionine synthetase
MARRTIFSSESVTRGHPDKICDQVADGIVDAFLFQDSGAEVAAECAVSTGLVFLAVNSIATVSVDVTRIARDVIADIGYSAESGFDPETCSVVTSVSHRTPDGGSAQRTQQASLFGYACLDTPERMPLPIALAHGLARRLDEVRQKGVLPYLAPDGKTLVAVEFQDDQPLRIHTVIVSAQHTPALDRPGRLEADLREAVLPAVFDPAPLAPDKRTKVLINPGGAFLVGGPRRDAGLTGRKTVVDTYGGFARQGGGALSGKDPAHVDRFGAYAARYMARNVVAAGLARRCEVQLSYGVGEEHPLAVTVQTFGTGTRPDQQIERALVNLVDLRPTSIVEAFSLRTLPERRGGEFYRTLAAYGHFGRTDLDVPWEREDLVAPLGKALRAG